MSTQQPTVRFPPARVDVVTEQYYGITVDDPYRWLEDIDGEEPRSWIAEQAQAARMYLDQLPRRDWLFERVRAASATAVRVQGIHATAGAVWMLRRDASSEVARLVRIDCRTNQATVLVDPGRGDTTRRTILEFAPSPNGRYVAYTAARTGTEDTSLFVYDSASDQHIDRPIERTRFGAIAWLDGGSTFTYNQIPVPPDGANGYADYAGSRVRLHVLGSDPADDPIVFGPDTHDAIDLAPYDVPMLERSSDGQWLVVRVHHGTQPELSLYAAPFGDVRSLYQGMHWRTLAQPDDAVVGYAVDGGHIWLRTHRDAARYRVVVTELADPDLRTAPTVVPPSTAVVEDLVVVNGVVVLRDLDGGLARLRCYRHGELTEVGTPVSGSIVGWAHEPGATELLVVFESWTIAPQVFRFDPVHGSFAPTSWLPPTPPAYQDLVAEEVQVRSRDGTAIPLSIVGRRDLPRDGARPTIVFAYGAFGIPAAPFFWPRLLPWFELGGVYAIAHVRGGGEYGQEWHAAGRGANKQRTTDDTIACAEYLIAQGYTNAQQLAVEGDSAGGITAGMVLVQRPDVVAAAVMLAPLTNPLRLEHTPVGRLYVSEFGSLSNENDFQALYAMDAYTLLEDGVAYPAVLASAGFNDPRAPVWQAAKFVARLQQASASGKPVLLRVDYQAAHANDTRQQADGEQADVFAFLLAQLGTAAELVSGQV